MYNHNKAQQSKNREHISWDILHVKSMPFEPGPKDSLNVLLDLERSAHFGVT